jgi:hypothetical protein
MEWTDVFEALKNKGYKTKFNDAHNQITIGSWRNNYRFKIRRNNGTRHLCLENCAVSQYLAGLWTGSAIMLMNFLSRQNASLTLVTCTYAFLSFSILYIRYLGKKERRIKQDLDTLLFELNLDEYKANHTLADS